MKHHDLFTPDDVEALREALEILDSHCDEGPENEGWQSRELVNVRIQLGSLAERIEALVPPSGDSEWTYDKGFCAICNSQWATVRPVRIEPDFTCPKCGYMPTNSTTL